MAVCQMISAIFFDFDGVLTLNDRGSTITIETIRESNPDVAASRVEDCYYRFHHQLLLGEKNHYDVWDDYCRCIGKEIDSELLVEAFLATPMNTRMLEFASELARGYQIGIITANATERMAVLVNEHRLDSLFDPIVISAEVGALKTSSLIFEAALNGRKPEECVFVDNQGKNLAVPAMLGFKTYLFDPRQNDIPRLRSQLAKWGVESSARTQHSRKPGPPNTRCT